MIWYELDIMAMSMLRSTMTLMTLYEPNMSRAQKRVNPLMPVRSKVMRSIKPKLAQNSDCDVSNKLQRIHCNTPIATYKWRTTKYKLERTICDSINRNTQTAYFHIQIWTYILRLNKLYYKKSTRYKLEYNKLRLVNYTVIIYGRTLALNNCNAQSLLINYNTQTA